MNRSGKNHFPVTWRLFLVRRQHEVLNFLLYYTYNYIVQFAFFPLKVLKAVKDLAEDENSWRLIDSVTVRPTYSNIHQKSEQLKSTTINLTRPVKIFPKTYYALKVQMSGGSGKTFYGESK